jgi:hypothetical protein
MFSLANVMNFFSYEFSRLRRRRFSLPCVLSSSLNGLWFWHISNLASYKASFP